MELCRANSIPAFQRNFTLIETCGAQVAVLTGTLGGPPPDSEIDGRRIGKDCPAPILVRIGKLYDELIRGDAAARRDS